MNRKFIATILAAAIAITGLSAKSAHAMDDDDFAKLLFGATALFIIGNAINDRDDDYYYYNQPRQRPPSFSPAHRKRVLPARCLRRIEARDGRRKIMTRRCLERHYRQAHRLPRDCKTRVRVNRDRVVKGYKPRCLRRHGYRISNR